MSAPHSELEEMTLAEMAQRMESGETSSRSLVEGYLERIEQIDRSGPTLRSIIETNPDAIQIAEELDRSAANVDHVGRCTASRSWSRTTSTRPIDDDHGRVARA